MNLTISFRKDDIYFHPILYLCVRISYGKSVLKHTGWLMLIVLAVLLLLNLLPGAR